ncbi:MAG: hypothetical protein M3044_17815 [Thermoproteota archaeon]|nr:hypothetical protein [Thermoproteota archaeon]
MPEFPTAERGMTIDSLINNAELEEILVIPQHNNNYFAAENEKAYYNELQRQQNPQSCNSIHESGHNDKRSRSPTTHPQIYRIRLGYIYC